MNPPTATVLIVDDDASVRKALARLCGSAGWNVRTFARATEFLEASPHERPSCLVLDVCMPDKSGLDLQAELAAREIQIPIVFITGHGDIPTSVRAMKAGAVDFLTKPFRNQDLLAVVASALSRDVQQASADGEREALRQRVERLTPRERQVLELVVRGLLNKQVAGELGVSELTVKVHRARVMEKMQMESLAGLVQAAVKLGILPP